MYHISVYFYTNFDKLLSISCRENLCSVLLALEKHLNDIAWTSEQMVGYQEKIGKLDKEISILTEAVSTPNHPLISMQDR